MKTAHKRQVKKLRCPICLELVSTITNMRVHLKREGLKNNENYKLRKNKVNGVPIEEVWVQADSLQHGRYYGLHDGPSNNAKVEKLPKQKRRAKNTRSAVETIGIDDSDFSESDDVPLARIIEAAHNEESMDATEFLQQSEAAHDEEPMEATEFLQQTEAAHDDEPIDAMELLQQSEGTIFVFFQFHYYINSCERFEYHVHLKQNSNCLFFLNQLCSLPFYVNVCISVGCSNESTATVVSSRTEVENPENLVQGEILVQVFTEPLLLPPLPPLTPRPGYAVWNSLQTESSTALAANDLRHVILRRRQAQAAQSVRSSVNYSDREFQIWNIY